MASHQVFYRKSGQNICKNAKKNIKEGNRKNRKMAENRWSKGAKSPMVTNDHGVSFRVSGCLAPVIFPKSDFQGTKSVDLHQYHGSTVEIRGLSSDILKLLADQPRKHTFCLIDLEIDRTNGTCPLVTINVWSYMIIWQQSTWKSIGDHGFLHRG